MIFITFELFIKKNSTLPQEQKQLHKISQPAKNLGRKNPMGFCCRTWICWTSLNCSRTSLESPPAAASPHVKTKPSRLTAAKALQVDWIYLKETRTETARNSGFNHVGKHMVFLNAFYMVLHASIGFHFVVIFVPWLFLQVGIEFAENDENNREGVTTPRCTLETLTAGCSPYKWWFPSSVF